MTETSILKVTVNRSSEVVRHVFVKLLATDNDKRSAILANIPCFCDCEPFERLISENFGELQSITYHSSIEKIGINESRYDGEKLSPIDGYRVAVIRFRRKSSIQKLFETIESEEKLSLYGDGKPLTGIRRWQNCYNRSILDIKSVKEEIAAYIAEYDKKVEMEKERAKSMEGVPDEEGWIKVTRHGKKPFLPNSESLDKKITEKMQRKKMKLEVDQPAQ